MSDRRRDDNGEDDYPNPTGGFGTLLYPIRGVVLVAAIVLVPVLVIVSLLR